MLHNKKNYVIQVNSTPEFYFTLLNFFTPEFIIVFKNTEIYIISYMYIFTGMSNTRKGMRALRYIIHIYTHNKATRKNNLPISTKLL